MDKPLFYLKDEDKCAYLYPEAAELLRRDSSTRYVLHNENTDIVLKPIINIKTLYHYCNIHTMMSIVRSQSLWLTNCLFSNDSKELEWAVDRLNESINSLYQSEIFEKNAYSKVQMLNILNQILEETKNHIFPTYVTCFSVEGDSLSQWRGYGDDGRGVAIGLNGDCNLNCVSKE